MAGLSQVVGEQYEPARAQNQNYTSSIVCTGCAPGVHVQGKGGGVRTGCTVIRALTGSNGL